MARPFNELRDKMTPEARERVDHRVRETLLEQARRLRPRARWRPGAHRALPGHRRANHPVRYRRRDTDRCERLVPDRNVNGRPRLLQP